MCSGTLPPFYHGGVRLEEKLLLVYSPLMLHRRNVTLHVVQEVILKALSRRALVGGKAFYGQSKKRYSTKIKAFHRSNIINVPRQETTLVECLCASLAPPL